MIPDWIADAVWMSRRRALALGYSHEGTHFGVPVFCKFEEDDEDAMGEVIAKTWFLEWVISAGSAILWTVNMFREPGDELLFAFCIRPIQAEASA